MIMKELVYKESEADLLQTQLNLEIERKDVHQIIKLVVKITKLGYDIKGYEFKEELH